MWSIVAWGFELISGKGRFCLFALCPAEQGQRNQQWFAYSVHQENKNPQWT